DAVPGAVPVLAAPDEHVLAVDPLERRSERLERGTRAFVQGIGLELDAAAAERLERVLELQQLRLHIRAGAPGGRVKPRPPDLDRAVLRPQREVASGADDLPTREGRERNLRAVARGGECVLHPGRPFLARPRLHEAEPAPRPLVTGGEPETLLVVPRERLEP